MGRNWPVLPGKPDFQDKTSALMVLETHEGSFLCVSGSKGNLSCTATIDCKLGNHRIQLELALGAQRSTGEGRQSGSG